MAIWQFSRWRMFAILNFMGLRIGSLKIPCNSRDHSSRLVSCWENRVFVYAFWRQADERTPTRKDAASGSLINGLGCGIVLLNLTGGSTLHCLYSYTDIATKTPEIAIFTHPILTEEPHHDWSLGTAVWNSVTKQWNPWATGWCKLHSLLHPAPLWRIEHRPKIADFRLFNVPLRITPSH